jgi:hypothetical protein
MSNIPYNNNPNDTCMFCSHPYLVHYSDDIHGLGSKDAKDVHSGCTYTNPVDGSQCSCQGFRSSSIPTE